MPQNNERSVRFIGTFVNEMYAILLGIGMGSVVLFRDEFSLTDFFELGSAIFVVVVVILYWWDWVEAIEEQVATTKREFVIDLLILFVFLLMFASYNRPHKLAALFVALSVLNLLWVMNFCREAQLGKVLSGVNVRRWIGRKIAAVAIFSICYAVLHYPSKLVSSYVEYVELAMVFVFFALVRRFCFGEANRIPAVLVRRAQEADIPDIVRIHNSHVLRPSVDASEVGFLLGRVSRELVAEHFSRPSYSHYVATSARGNFLGFAAITTELPQEVSEVTWESDEVQEQIARHKQCHVLYLAVSSDATGQGVAQAMYAELYKLYDNAIVSTFVVKNPVINRRSFDFHEKQGFRCAGVFSRDEFYGLNDYQSRLLVRFAGA